MIKLKSRAPGSFLGDLIARKKTEVMEMNIRTRQSDLEQRLYPTERSFETALRKGGSQGSQGSQGSRNAKPVLLAAMRARAPWAGDVHADHSVDALAKAYDAGAAAVSYECDELAFGGDWDTLNDMRDAIARPVLARELIVSEYQVFYARTKGADSIVFSASVLSGDAMEELFLSARSMSMEPLLEVWSEAELEDALTTDAKIIGITNRDPETHKIDLENFHRLAPKVDASRILVCIGGINSRTEIDRLAGKADVVSVGRTLFGAPDVASKIRELGF